MFMEGTEQGKEGRATLFRVLAVYTLYNPEVAYCQGIVHHHGLVYEMSLITVGFFAEYISFVF